MLELNYNGKTFKSVKDLWRQECRPDVPYITFWWRVNNGWTIKEALNIGPIPPRYRRSRKKDT